MRRLALFFGTQSHDGLRLAYAAKRAAFEANSDLVGVQTVLRSRAKFAYLAAYRVDRGGDDSAGKDAVGGFERVSDDELFEDEQLRATPLPADWVRVMDATPEEAMVLDATCVELKVGDLLALTRLALERGEGLPPEGAQPRYVQGDTPWKPS